MVGVQSRTPEQHNQIMKHIKSLIVALLTFTTILFNASAGSVQGDGWSGTTTKFPADSWTLAPSVMQNPHGLVASVHTIAYGAWIMQSKVTVYNGAKVIKTQVRSWTYAFPSLDNGEAVFLKFGDVVNTNKRYVVEVWMTAPGETAVSYYGKAVLYGEK